MCDQSFVKCKYHVFLKIFLMEYVCEIIKFLVFAKSVLAFHLKANIALSQLFPIWVEVYAENKTKENQ